MIINDLYNNKLMVAESQLNAGEDPYYYRVRQQTPKDIELEISPKAWDAVGPAYATYEEAQAALKALQAKYPNERFTYTQHPRISNMGGTPHRAFPQGVAEGIAGVPVHRIGLTVTDPNHPMVSKRGETIQKTVRVPGADREKAINSAIAHYRRKGYKVHDHHYIGTVDAELIAEGVAETLPMSDAVKVLKHYGAEHFKTTSNELHFYKNGKPLSVDLIWNDDATRSVSISQLNSATRSLKGQGVAEVSKATLDRYVPKAVDAHGHADFAARQSKDDPTLRSYHKSQKHTAEKRRQGISRALDRMSKTEGVAEGKKPDNYHIVNKDGKPASLASYADRASAEKDRDAKHPGAEVRQVGPRGKVKGVSESMADDMATMAQKNFPNAYISKNGQEVQKPENWGKKYVPPAVAPVDLEKQQRELTAKYPNIDELVRKAELNRDPNYEYADGQAYYAARDAEQNYQKLRQIQRVIQGLNESLDRSHLP